MYITATYVTKTSLPPRSSWGPWPCSSCCRLEQQSIIKLTIWTLFDQQVNSHAL